MFKILFLVLFIIAALVLPAHTSSQTLEQEKNLMMYISKSIDDYVQTVDWSLDKVYGYSKELDHIASLIKRCGYGVKDYHIGLYGKVKPVALTVILRGKANPIVKPQWKFMWVLNSPDQVPPNLNDNKKRYGI